MAKTEKNVFFRLPFKLSTPKVLPNLVTDFFDWKKARIRKTTPTPPISSVRLLKTSKELGKASVFVTKLNPVVVNPETLSK